MVAKERPCVAGGGGVCEDPPRPFHEAVSVGVVAEYCSSFDTPHDDMMQHSLGIKAGMAGHKEMVASEGHAVKGYLLIYGRPSRFLRGEQQSSRRRFEPPPE